VAASAGPADTPTASGAAMLAGTPLRDLLRLFNAGVESVICFTSDKIDH
jgi:hypothetical protein